MRPLNASASVASVRDRALLARCRAGEHDAYGELFSIYRAYAVKIASQYTSCCDIQDVVSEAFTRIWAAIQSGSGPQQDFKGYLASSVRNICCNWHAKKCPTPVEQETLVILSPSTGDTGAEAAMRDSDRKLVAEVFESLPERWRTALWTVSVEGKSIAELAELLGLTSNAASALCVRARHGLKAAWVKAVVDDPEMAPLRR